MTADGIELTEFLRKTLHKDKIMVVGHSWGSILGIFMVKAGPELFHAFVGTGQVADPARNYVVAYEELLRKAIRMGEQRAIRELRGGSAAVRERPRLRGATRMGEPLRRRGFLIASMFGLALSAPGYALRDVNDCGDGQSLSAERLVPQTSAPGRSVERSLSRCS